MPVTDDYGQGVSIASLTDKPDAEKLGKDIANGIVQRGVLRFADAAERNATLTTPEPGMVAYLAAEDFFTGYTTAGWMVLAAGQQAWTTISLNSGWTHNGNSNGTFQFRRVNLFGEPTIMLRGGIGRASYPSTLPPYFILNSVMLPVNARPTTLRTIIIPSSDISADRITMKLDLRTDGQIRLYGVDNANKPPWVGFNGSFCSL
ncbi:hypothetical protein JJV70_02060 [Streptomyces sp. JJ66]|uniref:hypothetical protein n=1 Tax=Streptomyces sp. JJ66 TaxID=2803843 RepID=UPI001C585C95|nr:hypothetical protein [Streptomyces sp. JJ66]MBW1600905.1 hypothetical protein [Streptomyces sp. JJ66]